MIKKNKKKKVVKKKVRRQRLSHLEFVKILDEVRRNPDIYQNLKAEDFAKRIKTRTKVPLAKQGVAKIRDAAHLPKSRLNGKLKKVQQLAAQLLKAIEELQ